MPVRAMHRTMVYQASGCEPTFAPPQGMAIAKRDAKVPLTYIQLNIAGHEWSERSIESSMRILDPQSFPKDGLIDAASSRHPSHR